MSLNDIYEAKLWYETPGGRATVTLHYQESLTGTDIDEDTLIMADAMINSHVQTIAFIQSSEVKCIAQEIHKLNAVAVPYRLNAEFAGARGASAWHSNQAMRLKVRQGTFPSNRDGLVWIPGASDVDVNGNQFTVAWRTEADLTENGLESPAVTGVLFPGFEYTLGVLSEKHLFDNPGDFAGAFAPITDAVVSNIPGKQRRRRTRRGNPGYRRRKVAP